MTPIEKRRIPGLDGLRAVAISLVLGQHLQTAGWIQGFPPELGRLGVALFFALSGYLITGILLDKPIKLVHFYWRRSLRIFPAYYAYLTVAFGLILVGWHSAPPTAMLAAATYWLNFYREGRGWSFMHLWSLAVEEQFYLCWPLVLGVLGRRWAAFGLIVILTGWPLQRYARTGRWGHPDIDSALFAVTFDVIFWGCLAAIYQRERLKEGRCWLVGRYAILLPILMTTLLYADLWHPFVEVVPWLRNGALAWIVLWVAQNGTHTLTRCLEWPAMKWLGSRSYSVYLWHLLFMDPRLKTWIPWPTAVLLGLACAELSYRWIETPILTWRDKKAMRI